MARKLDFQSIDQVIETNDSLVEGRARRWKRREANPTVQMSVRMPEETYERFRALCEHERRTNGEMLGLMLEEYLRSSRKD